MDDKATATFNTANEKGTKGKELENKRETRYLGPRGVLLRFSVPRACRNLGKRNSYNGLFGWGRLLKSASEAKAKETVRYQARV